LQTNRRRWANPSGPNAKYASGSPMFPEFANSVESSSAPCAGPRQPSNRATAIVSSQIPAICNATCSTSCRSSSRGSAARAIESKMIAGAKTRIARLVIGARSGERTRPTA